MSMRIVSNCNVIIARNLEHGDFVATVAIAAAAMVAVIFDSVFFTLQHEVSTSAAFTRVASKPSSAGTCSPPLASPISPRRTPSDAGMPLRQGSS